LVRDWFRPPHSSSAIGCPVVVQSATATTEVLADGQAKAISWPEGEPRPILVWDAMAARIVREGKGVVYLGIAGGVAKPCDLGALLTHPAGRALAKSTDGRPCLPAKEPIAGDLPGRHREGDADPTWLHAVCTTARTTVPVG
jgi:hypothetical protein